MEGTVAAIIKSSRFFSGGFNSVLVTGLFVVIMFGLANGSLILSGQENIPVYINIWLNNTAGEDSWGAMGLAYEWLITNNGLLYQEILFNQAIKFQYPPTSLLLFAAASAGDVTEPEETFNYIGRGFVLVDIMAVAALALLYARRIKLSAGQQVLLAAIAAFACLTFYPVLKAYALGQIQTWINAWFALACLCWATDRKAAAGILIGAICLIKPQFSLFLIWGGLRRQWAFLAGWLSIVIPGVATSVAMFGLPNHLDYLSALEFFARHGEAFYPNQSVNGLLNRLLENGNNLEWISDRFAPFNPLVYAGTLVSSIAMLLFALLGHTRKRPVTLFDFISAGLIFTLASPIAWEHHYGIMPPAFVALYFAIQKLPRSGFRTLYWLCLATAHMLAAHYLTFTKTFAATPLNFLQSYLFFGALTVVWLLNTVPDPDVIKPPQRLVGSLPVEG